MWAASSFSAGCLEAYIQGGSKQTLGSAMDNPLHGALCDACQKTGSGSPASAL